ncbi:MAG: hypothetical protein IPN49_14245 [Saprospiraceae bacterium]|nr:hypothetical protein [Saprospiraceae bacterium]MBK8820183.1 hypothetical protein [Saprospiraceae bacterium]
MKTLFIFLLTVSVFSSCGLFEREESKPCPYILRYNQQHSPLIPVTISPNQLYYQVGDTIHISAIFEDSVYDYNAERKFLLKNFPFDHGVKLWRFENDSTWERGFAVNELLIDTIYVQRWDGGADKVGILYLDFVEKDNFYRCEMKLVLKKKGRYIFHFEDVISRYPGELYDERILPYTFEGKCENRSIKPIAMIQGDDHLDDFVPELVYMDKRLFYDTYGSIDYKDYFNSPYGTGSKAWEFIGTYGFEVR